MACMEDPAKRLGEVIGRVDLPWDVFHDDMALMFPVLNGKPLDVDVTRSLGGDISVDHLDCGFIIAVEDRGCQLWVAKIM